MSDSAPGPIADALSMSHRDSMKDMKPSILFSSCCRIRNICLGKLTKSKYCPFKKIGAPFDIPYLAGLTKSGGKKIFKCGKLKTPT
ncbi:hypothetical protein pdam_00013865 [Pocillopora damicornis]|uniref:Uncharacterized protein n=1 Tax=Pocillopora damicornis TaxID=46731 RepID=A0A3M6UL44_POCDA|nr:hypothetical protein pdam_00013865 [Pocillopora damicornis]